MIPYLYFVVCDHFLAMYICPCMSHANIFLVLYGNIHILSPSTKCQRSAYDKGNCYHLSTFIRFVTPNNEKVKPITTKQYGVDVFV